MFFSNERAGFRYTDGSLYDVSRNAVNVRHGSIDTKLIATPEADSKLNLNNYERVKEIPHFVRP